MRGGFSNIGSTRLSQALVNYTEHPSPSTFSDAPSPNVMSVKIFNCSKRIENPKARPSITQSHRRLEHLGVGHMLTLCLGNITVRRPRNNTTDATNDPFFHHHNFRKGLTAASTPPRGRRVIDSTRELTNRALPANMTDRIRGKGMEGV